MTKTDKHDIADVVLVTLLSVIFSVIGVAIRSTSRSRSSLSRSLR